MALAEEVVAEEKIPGIEKVAQQERILSESAKIEKQFLFNALCSQASELPMGAKAPSFGW